MIFKLSFKKSAVCKMLMLLLFLRVKAALFHLLGEVTIKKPRFNDAIFFPRDDETKVVE